MEVTPFIRMDKLRLLATQEFAPEALKGQNSRCSIHLQARAAFPHQAPLRILLTKWPSTRDVLGLTWQANA